MRRVAEVAAVFSVFLAYTHLFRDTFVDDAFISLKYSDMLAAGEGWTFLPGRMSNTATSPLNVIVHAAIGMLIGSMPYAIVVATALELTVSFFLLQRIARHLFGHTYFAWLAIVGLATNCLLVSTFGLEGTLFTVLLLWSVERFLAQRWIHLGIVLGLIVMARPDGALLVPIYMAAMPGRWTQRVSVALVCALTLAPWELFSWVHLGSFVPDTLQIKVGQRGWGRGLSLVSGMGFYYQKYPLEFLATFTLAPFVPLAWRSSSREVKTVASVLAGYGVLHLAAYTVMGIPPYHWYYTNQAVPAVIVGALGVTVLVTQAWQRASGMSRAALAVTVLLPAAGLAVSTSRIGWPLKQAPIHTNWGTHDEYREVGLWLRQHIPADTTIFMVSEMGTVPFYAQRLIINEFSDANMIYKPILERYPTLPWPAQRAVDVNFFWRRLQPPVADWPYKLHHYEWPNDDEASFRDQIVKSWDTSTRWIPSGRLYLIRLKPASQPPAK